MVHNHEQKAYLRREFEIKDGGVVKYFLGIEVPRSKRGIVISNAGMY